MKNPQLQLLLRLGLVAALVSCIADVLLLYVQEGGYEQGDYSFLFGVSATRLLWGTYLGFLAIPFQLLGFLAVRQVLLPAGRQLVNGLSGLVFFLTVVGTAYHGQLGLYGFFMQQLNVGLKNAQLLTGLKNCPAFFEPLSTILMLLYVILSILLAYCVAYKPTHYRYRWVAWGNPALIYLVLLGFYWLNKPIGGLFMVAGLNFSIFLWLLLTLLYTHWDNLNNQ